MKKTYNAPEAVEVLFDTQDVITTSNNSIGVESSGDGMNVDW